MDKQSPPIGYLDGNSISKPDKTPFCFAVYCLSRDLFHAIYSENKDFHGYILLEKHLRSLDISVNVFKRMKGCKKLTICWQSFYSVSVENYSIDKVITHVKRWGKVFRTMISGGRLCHANIYCCQNSRHNILTGRVFPTFWRLRRFWARYAECSLAARHEVRWCERPWLFLKVLLHPLQVIIMIMRRNMIFIGLADNGSCDLNSDCFMSDEVHAPFSFTTTVHINYLTLLGIMSSHSGDEDSQAEEDHPKRKSRLLRAWNHALGNAKGVFWFLPVQLRINLVA